MSAQTKVYIYLNRHRLKSLCRLLSLQILKSTQNKVYTDLCLHRLESPKNEGLYRLNNPQCLYSGPQRWKFSTINIYTDCSLHKLKSQLTKVSKD